MITTQYQVRGEDTNPLRNQVIAYARLVNDVTVEINDEATVSILKAESQLQLILTTLPASQTGGPGFQPGETITYQLQVCNADATSFTKIEFLGNSPTKITGNRTNIRQINGGGHAFNLS
ncbi:MAG: hypothetical protein HC915_00725 [Anaerolineae bacterium]|nr:hypothetical protein [Anaerolineae bacterium]